MRRICPAGSPRRLRTISISVSVFIALAGCAPPEPGLPPPRSPLSATPDQAFRHQPPEPAPLRPYRPPVVQVAQLDNGLTLILLPRPGAPVASVRFVTRRGGEDGPRSQAGLAWMTGEVLASHTAGSSPLGEEHLLERHGLRPDVQVDRELAALSVWMTSDRLTQALELLAQTVREPTFLASDVERARAVALRQLGFYWSNPERNALSHARQVLYGPSHRATLPIWGIRTTVSGFTREQLIEHYRATWTPRASALVVAGDVNMTWLREQSERLFGTWESPEETPAELTEPSLPSPWTGARILGHQTRASQSMIMLVERAPARSSEDYVPFALMTRVLGQMFSSPLNLNLREEHGYSYGVHAEYAARRHDGDLVFLTHVSQERLISAIRAVIEELRRLRDQGPTEEQLATARTLMREELVATLERSSSASAALAELFADGYPPDELPRLERRIRQATAAEVREVARRWVRPDEAPIMVTARPEILQGLAASGIGEYQEMR